MKLRAVVLATLVVAALSAGSAVGPAAAQAGNATGTYAQDSEVDSCTTIDQSGTYTLTAVIANDTTDACFEITASDVTLDGNGHTVDGVDDTGTGVAITDSSITNVTVRDLTVTNFQRGANVEDASGVTLRDVDATGNGNDGVSLDGADDATVVDGEMRDNGERGVYATRASTSLVVRNTTISSNDEDGVRALGLVVSSSSAQVTIENNALDSNPNGGGGIGVAETTGAEIRNNTASNSGGPGVWLDSGSADAVVADNDLTSNQKGIQVGRSTVNGFDSADGVTLSGNDVSGSENEGIHVLGSENVVVSENDVTNNGGTNAIFGVNATASNGITVANNTVENNIGGVYLLDSDDGTARDNVVTGTEYGLIAEDATGATVEDNTVTENTYDGITVIGGSDAVVESNTATGNEWGLFLVQTDSVTAVGNDVSANVNGTALDAATNVTLTDTLAANNTGWALHAATDSTVASATNYTITGDASVNLSAHDAALRANETLPEPPANTAPLGPQFNATDTATGGWLNLTVGYDGSTLADGANESTTRLWRHDGSWSDDIGGTNAVDEANDTVTANVTSFSTFSLLADEEPVANVTPTSVDFGTTDIGDTRTAEVTLANDGLAPLSIDGFGQSGENVSQFNTPGFLGTIQPGDNTTLPVEFTPDSAGDKDATISISHNASGSPTTVSLSGEGVWPDARWLVTEPVDFGDVNVGESPQMTLEVENNGSAPLDLGGVSRLGPDPTSFQFTTSGDPTPTTVQPGDTAAFVVQFVPGKTLGERTAYLNVSTDVTDRQFLNMTMVGESVDTEAPVLSDATAVNADDASSLVGRDGAVEVNATVTDNLDVDNVTVDASALGNETVELTDGDGDDVYDRTIAVDAENATDGDHGVTVTATDSEGNENVTTTEVTVDTTEGDGGTDGISSPPADDQEQTDDGSDDTREIFIGSATIRDAVAVPDGVTPVYAERVRLPDEQSEPVNVTFTENTTASSVRFPPGTSGTVTVTAFEEPTGLDEVAPGQVLTAFQLTGTDAVRDTTATVRIRVPRGRLGGADPSDLRVAHRVDGDWTLPETSVLREGDDAVLLETTVDSFSPFVVTAVGEPDAELTVTPSTAESGTEFTLDASDASTPYGEIVSYEWSVAGEELSGETATVALDEPGEYTVRLTVTTDAGRTATTSTRMTVDTAATPTDTTPTDATPTADGTTPTDDGTTPTETTPPATDGSPTPTEAADDGGPGFGVIVALVGLLVAAGALARRAR